MGGKHVARRWLALAVVSLVAVIGSGGYVLYSQLSRDAELKPYVDELYSQWLSVRKDVLEGKNRDVLRRHSEMWLALKLGRAPTKEEVDAEYARELDDCLKPLTEDHVEEMRRKFAEEAVKFLEAEMERRRALRKKILDSCVRRIDTYGKVVDQYGKPVPGAKITYDVLFTLIDPDSTKFTTRSDANGMFHIAPKKPIYSLYLARIEKDGYVFTHNKKSFANAENSRDDSDACCIDATRENPAVFVMRKRDAKPTFLIYDRYGDRGMKVAGADGEGEFYYSFILEKPLFRKFGDDRKLIDAGNYDVRVSASFDKEKREWTVRLSATGAEGGFVFGDELLGMAPADGYKNNVEFKYRVPDAGGWTAKFFPGRYVYVRSRPDPIYTRVRSQCPPLGYTIGYTEKELKFKMGAFYTNPFGERNLELDETMPGAIRMRLKKMVREAFDKGRRPVKPDIGKMLADFKKTHTRVRDFYSEWIWIENDKFADFKKTHKRVKNSDGEWIWIKKDLPVRTGVF